MADVNKIKTFLDAYGVGVRAGAITPSVEDEVYFRDQLGLPEASRQVIHDWARTNNTRQPITLEKEATKNQVPDEPQ